jgi:hypothetical protein
MTKIILAALLFIGLSSYAQVLKIDTLKLQPSEQFKSMQSEKMNYPLIRTGNAKIDSQINIDLKNKFTHDEYPDESIDSTIYKWADDQIIFLDYEITYNKNGILSLNISAEGCGAYCTNWTDYFNYSILTGKSLDLNSVIDTSGNFRTLVVKQRKAQFENKKKELKDRLLDKSSELDSASYELALEYYERCNNTFMFENFALYNDHLKIIEICDLPHFMQNLTPFIELEYKYADIQKYLRIKNVRE